MFTSYGGLKDIVPIVEQLTRLPGKALAQFSGILSLALSILGYFVVTNTSAPIRWVPLIVGLVCLAITAVFAFRRSQLERAVDSWLAAQESTVDGEVDAEQVDFSTLYSDEAPSDSQDVIVLNEDGTPFTGAAGPTRSVPAADSRAQRIHDAQLESAQRRDTWMPGVEAAQRAAVAAAGGTVNAPYLKPDLRVTIVSALLTMGVIPLGIFFSIVCLFALV